MPKIFSAGGFVIYVYPGEQSGRHHLLHIHIYRGSYSGEALVVQIPELLVLASTMKISDARGAMRVVEENLTEILEAARKVQ